ncbi:MAG: cation diffusion facilitator family transporter [Chloroflexota bacterium]|nr:cation diffusion facilitator family transporter [Chloroflexota bacterium]
MATNSLALLADSAHVFADVAGIGLSLAAIWLGSRPTSTARTFGLFRAEMLAAVLNALLLFALAAFILIEAARRLAGASGPEIADGPMLAVASVALLANLGSAWLLRGGQATSLNARAAFLEVLGDALGDAAVIVAALAIRFTGYARADAIASGLIGLLILPRTWGLLRDAVDVLLEATPRNVSLERVRGHILEAPGVTDVHDLHAWTITSGKRGVSARHHRRRHERSRRARPPLSLPREPVRYRALDIPARDARSSPPGGRHTRLTDATNRRKCTLPACDQDCDSRWITAAHWASWTLSRSTGSGSGSMWTPTRPTPTSLG